MGSIGEVECIRLKADPHALANLHRLGQREVGIVVAWTTYNALLRIAIHKRARRRETARVEPLRDRVKCLYRRAGNISAVGDAVIKHVDRRLDAQRLARLQECNRAYVPSA